MSVVAINAGSIKIKNIETYGTNEKFNIRSNLSITGNMDVTKNLLILSEIESTSVNSGGIIAVEWYSKKFKCRWKFKCRL